MSTPYSTPNGYVEASDATSEEADGADESQSAKVDELGESWAAIFDRWSELREYATYYVAANLDRFRLTYRRAIMWSILGIVAGTIGLSVVGAASVLFVVSLATGLGELMGGRIWLGQLLVSLVILGLATGGVWFALKQGLAKYRRNLIKKYEGRKQQERTAYGTDVEKRAQDRAQSV